MSKIVDRDAEAARNVDDGCDEAVLERGRSRKDEVVATQSQIDEAPIGNSIHRLWTAK